MLGTIKYAGIEKQSVSDGIGIREVIFLQGCINNCKGCHNKELQNINGGYKIDIKELAKKIIDNLTPLHSGITLSGGDPLFQLKETTLLVKELKRIVPDLNIWLYTGYKWEEISNYEIMKYIDVVVDGKFKIENKDLNLTFRGSSNQRIINVHNSKTIPNFN